MGDGLWQRAQGKIESVLGRAGGMPDAAAVRR